MNAFNKLLVSSFLGAAALGAESLSAQDVIRGAARAATRTGPAGAVTGAITGQTAAADTGQQKTDIRTQCTDLGKERGVFEKPAARKAFHDTGSDDAKFPNIGCVYSYGAGGEFRIAAGYNLADANQANSYNRELTAADKIQTAADDKEMRLATSQAKKDSLAAEREARANNPVKKATEMARDINQAVRAADQVNNAAKRACRLLKC